MASLSPHSIFWGSERRGLEGGLSYLVLQRLCAWKDVFFFLTYLITQRVNEYDRGARRHAFTLSGAFIFNLDLWPKKKEFLISFTK